MKVFKLSFLFTCFLVLTLSCTSKNKAFDDDEFSTETEATASSDDLNLDEALSEQAADVKTDTKSVEKGSAADEFAEFEDTKITNPAAAATTEDDLEKEMNLLESPAPVIANKENPAPEVPIAQELGLDIPPPEVSTQVVPNVQPPAADIVAKSIPESPVESTAPITTISTAAINQISSVQYKSNQSGPLVFRFSNTIAADFEGFICTAICW